MREKHTPGPWSINYDCEYAKHGQLSIETNDFFIALVDAGLIAQQANARLIAASPDLLAFAQEWLELQGTDENYMTAKARAAITKAIG